MSRWATTKLNELLISQTVVFAEATTLSQLNRAIAHTVIEGLKMKASIAPHELMRLIHRAEEAYKKRGASAIAQRLRIAAMKRFVTDMKAQAPNANLQISLEDHLLLTDLPES